MGAMKRSMMLKALKPNDCFTLFMMSFGFCLNLAGCDAHQASQSPSTLVSPNQSNDIKVVTPDWGVAATMAAMGKPPIATGDIRVWEQWVGEPQLPNSVVDLGIRYQPNAELAAQLEPDLLIDNFFYEHARGVYGDVKNVSIIVSGTENNKADASVRTWQDFITPTLELGDTIGEPERAKAYISESKQEIVQKGEVFRAHQPNIKRFAVAQFVDGNNFRMYAKNSLFNPAMNLMGLELVELGEGNGWGFTSQQVGDLAKLDADVCLLIIEPLNAISEAELKESLVWQRLGYGQTGDAGRCMAKLPPVWIYGGMASLTRVADMMATADYVGGGAL